MSLPNWSDVDGFEVHEEVQLGVPMPEPGADDADYEPWIDHIGNQMPEIPNSRPFQVQFERSWKNSVGGYIESRDHPLCDWYWTNPGAGSSLGKIVRYRLKRIEPEVGKVYLLRGPYGEHFHKKVEGGWAFGIGIHSAGGAKKALSYNSCHSLEGYAVIREATAEELK